MCIRPVVLACLLLITFPCIAGAKDSYADWEEDLLRALRSGELPSMRPFFKASFREEELSTWSYRYERGFLDFASSRVIRLLPDAILVFIPTSDAPYTDRNVRYFDFVYRIFRIVEEGNGFLIDGRAMEACNPRFLNARHCIEVCPDSRTYRIDSEVEAETRSPFLLFKLAKEFVVDELTLDSKKLPYDRFGYFVLLNAPEADRIRFRVKGSIRTPRDNNQWLSISRSGFFLRFGGFAALPSSPPKNDGRYEFSNDAESMDLTLIHPREHSLLIPGEIQEDMVVDDKRRISVRMRHPYRSFYAQKNWDVRYVGEGENRIGFYFPKKDREQMEFLVSEVSGLRDWLKTRFHGDIGRGIHFAVCEKFYRGGLLNDNRWSIVAQNAEIIGTGGEGYVHEICHCAPQPEVRGNYLWIKEGFTNFLAFDYLARREDSRDIWLQKKREMVHDFGICGEKLSALRSNNHPFSFLAYQKAPWVYRMLESILGKESFAEGLIELGRKDGCSLRNLRAYFEIFERVSGTELTWFEDQWIHEREIPVLRVQYHIEEQDRGWRAQGSVVQEGKLFRFPLEVEFRMGEERITKHLWIDAASEDFIFDLPDEPQRFLVDPEARLLAVIKSGKRSFADPGSVRRGIAPSWYSFRAVGRKGTTEFNLEPSGEALRLSLSDGNDTSFLELTEFLVPIRYVSRGKEVYAADMEKSVIRFPHDAFHISEPVYPREFLPFLFSLVDWTRAESTSLLYLVPGKDWCEIATAKKTESSGNETMITISHEEGTIRLWLMNGVLHSYETSEGRTYTLVEE